MSSFPLHDACRKGDYKRTASILSKGGRSGSATINVDDPDGDTTPLRIAIARSDVALVRLLIAHGADVNYKDAQLDTPLHWASSLSDSGVVFELLSNGASVTSKNFTETTALHHAAECGSVAGVDLLLRHGAFAWAESRFALTPLHIAALRGHADVVRVLIPHCFQIVAGRNRTTTPLHLAVEVNRLNVVKLLLSQPQTGVDVVTEQGRTSLHIAVQYGHAMLAALLIKHGASLHAADDKGQTPLHVAASNPSFSKGQAEMMWLLLDHDEAPALIADAAGCVPAHCAAVALNGDAVHLLMAYRTLVDVVV